MPYRIRKTKCKRSDGKSGKYVLEYIPKGKRKYKRAGCHTSKKNASGQRAAIEGGPREADERLYEMDADEAKKKDQNSDGKNDFNDVKIARMLASGMTKAEIKKKHPHLFEAKKKSKTNPAYLVGDKTNKTKSNKQMNKEIKKCSKEPRPESCYEEWEADKTYKKKKNESIEETIANIEKVLLEIDEAKKKKKKGSSKISKSVEAKIRKIADKRGYTFGSMKAEYKKGLAAWLTGHRQGVSQHAWATARINKCTESQSWSGCKKSKSKKK